MVENRGQWNPLARYMADRGGLRIWFADGGPLYDLNDGQGAGHRLRLRFVGAAASRPTGEHPLEGRWSFIGGGAAASRPISAGAFSAIRYAGLYPGIDARYYDSLGAPKYDLLVAPGADPSAIRMRYDGAGPPRIGADGSLVIATSVGELREAPPECYQTVGGDRRRVTCRFVRDDRGIGFAVGAYDRSVPLVIDPMLIYSSYLGGSRADAGEGITLDSVGTIYVTGQTTSSDFPTTLGAYDRTIDAQTGLADIFIAKLDPTGSTILYATYIGGGAADIPAAIRVLSDGTAIVAGSTQSDNLPVPDGAYQRSNRGGWDGFVLALSPGGTRISFGSYLGGGSDDRIEDLAIGNANTIYVAGRTLSSNFPQSGVGGYRGGEDAFVARLGAGGTRLLYSAILGGTGEDRATGVAVEPGGAAWITGWSTSGNDFPTRHSLQPFNAGGSDGFVARVRFDGSALDYGTLIGGSAHDRPAAIALDSSGNIYITGSTLSNDYPNLSGSAPASWFATKFLWEPLSLSATIGYSRYIGAVDNGGGASIQVGRDGSAYLCGFTDSAARFPTGGGAVAGSPRGGFDIGFVRLDPAGEVLQASVIGGSGDDLPWHQSYLSRYGDLFITGSTTSRDLPLTRGAHDSTLNVPGIVSPTDAFVMRFNFQRRPAIFAEISHTLDTLHCVDSARYEFQVYNIGDSDLVITSKFFGESPFKLIPVDSTDSSGAPVVVIPPGGSKRYKVLVVFSGDRQGLLSDSLRIFSNDSLAGKNPFIIRFNIVRTRPVLVSVPTSPSVRLFSCGPDSLDFGLTVVNTGFGDFTLDPIVLARNNGAFSVNEPKIPPGGRVIREQSFPISLRFTPKRGTMGADGIYRDTIVLRAVESKECGGVLRIPLAGYIDTVTIASPDTAIRPAPLFACETSSVAYVRVENRGNLPVRIDSVSGDGFSMVTPLPHIIASGRVDSLRIAVAPPSAPGIYRSAITLYASPCRAALTLPLELRRLPAALLDPNVGALNLPTLRGCAGSDAAIDTVILLTRNPATWDGEVLLFPPIAPAGFILPDPITDPLILRAGDTRRLAIRYAPAEARADSGVLLIPYRAGPCVDTLRIPLSASRADVAIDAHPLAIALGDLVACDISRDTSVTVINRSRFPVSIATYRATEGISRVGQPPFSPVDPGDSFTVSLTLTPKRSGPILDSLIFYADPCGDSVVVVLRGNKEGAVISFDRDTLGFVPLLLCELPDTLDGSLILRNTGNNGAVTVSSARVIGDGAFTLAGDMAGSTIASGGALPLPVRFAPNAEGSFTARLEVVLEPCNDTVRALLAGNVLRGTIAVSGGSFGSVPLGSSGRADLVLKNMSPRALLIDTLRNLVPPFTLVGSVPALPATVPPGDSVVVTLEFTPRISGPYQPTLGVYTTDPCLDSTAAQLAGVGVAASSAAELCIAGRQAGISGDTIEIPVGSTTPGPIGSPADIIYRIGYDWRRLQFIGVSGGTLDPLDTSRPAPFIRLRQRGVTELRQEQFRLRFRLLAGPEADAVVRLDSVAVSSGDLPVVLCADSALVHIADRCVFTGVAPGKFLNRLDEVRPNPASTTVEVTYQQLEDTRAVLRIHDAMGREVLRPLDTDLPGGRYTIRFYVGDLPSGVYFYSIEAGEYRATRTMMVGR